MSGSGPAVAASAEVSVKALRFAGRRRDASPRSLLPPPGRVRRRHLVEWAEVSQATAVARLMDPDVVAANLGQHEPDLEWRDLRDEPDLDCVA